MTCFGDWSPYFSDDRHIYTYLLDFLFPIPFPPKMYVLKCIHFKDGQRYW